MLYGFREYHESIRERFSLQKITYLLTLGMFAAVTVFITVYSAQPNLNSFAKEETLNPVSEI